MAYQWIIDGKIGCHFPERGGLNPNFDVTEIKFTPDGTENALCNIESVYYFDQTAINAITAKSTTAEQLEEANKWRVWHRYWGYVEDKSLAYDSNLTDNYFKIFESPSTMTVTAVNVLTNNNTDVGTTACIVDYETGLTVAYGTTKTIASTVTTAYGLTGYNRSIAFDNPVTLDALKQYYIAVFRPDNDKTYNIAYDTTTTAQNKNKVSIQTSASNIAGKTYYGTATGTTMCQIIDEIMKNNNQLVYCTYWPNGSHNDWFTTGHIYDRNTNLASNLWYGICDGIKYRTAGVQYDNMYPGPNWDDLSQMSTSELGVADNRTVPGENSDGYSIFIRTNTQLENYIDTAFTYTGDGAKVIELAAYINTYLNWSVNPDLSARSFLCNKYYQDYNSQTLGTLQENTVYTTNNTKYTVKNLAGQTTEPSTAAAQVGDLYLMSGNHWANVGDSWLTAALVQWNGSNWTGVNLNDLFTPVTIENCIEVLENDKQNIQSSAWRTDYGIPNTALMNESINANNIAGYFKLDKNDGTTIEV